MKKAVCSIAVLLVLCLAVVFTFVGCDNPEQLQIYVPDGAPALAVVNIIESGKVGGLKANVTISTGEDVIAKCGSGQADIAIVPTNAAVKVCSSRSDYQLFTVSVWGLMYVVGWNDISSLAELNGKKLASIGLGNTGEYLFKRILDINNVSHTDNGGVTINYVDDGTTAVGMLLQNKCDFALLGEPATTNAINKAKSNGKTLYRVFDLQQLWQEVTESDQTGYPQASVIVKKSFLKRQGFADAMYNLLVENGNYLANNVEKLDGVLQSAGSLLTVTYTDDIVQRCNINAVKACTVKQDIYDYLEQFGQQFVQMLNENGEIYYEFNN